MQRDDYPFVTCPDIETEAASLREFTCGAICAVSLLLLAWRTGDALSWLGGAVFAAYCLWGGWKLIRDYR
jgi:hypothetical protein